jgi:NADH:ubiquinone oxidoreductase subunit 6 (subunit J)
MSGLMPWCRVKDRWAWVWARRWRIVGFLLGVAVMLLLVLSYNNTQQHSQEIKTTNNGIAVIEKIGGVLVHNSYVTCRAVHAVGCEKLP